MALYWSNGRIISEGYRVKSLRGTQFRIWASSVLKEYMKKGFAMNDDIWSFDGKALPEHVCRYILGVYYEIISNLQGSNEYDWKL